ncbi:cyclin-dependent kinase 1-A-like [Nematostella vectensis]|uniref:cyclin-dependent kinase 1-A-like n=1 Tax=Nematostella vectensis TaxID=45351 RepID=UPI002076D62D|nr:cyclin-dependent kinase 1-A-like [Nematostella vectensis]
MEDTRLAAKRSASKRRKQAKKKAKNEEKKLIQIRKESRCKIPRLEESETKRETQEPAPLYRADPQTPQRKQNVALKKPKKHQMPQTRGQKLLEMCGVHIQHQPPTNTNAQTRAKASTEKHRSLPEVSRTELTVIKDVKKEIGEGSYGICQIKQYRGNMLVVVKEFRRAVQKEEAVHEATVLQELQKANHHPSLPLLIGVALKERPYLLVTQFHGRGYKSVTLSSAVKKGLFTEVGMWLAALKTIAETLLFCHQKGFLHNDLKQNNVVFHYSGSWKPVVIDWGKASRVGDEVKFSKARQQKDYPWIAPEVLDTSQAKSMASDVYFFGYLVKYVITRVNDFNADGIGELSGNCLRNNANSRPSLEKVVSKFTKNKAVSYA